MRAILQTKPLIGSQKPYAPEEWIRTLDRGGYMEIEVPFPTQNRTGLPQAYFFLYLMPRQPYSFALAYPFDGFNEFIEQIVKEDVQETAFRKEWPLFDYLLVNSQQKMLQEFAKRPVMLLFADPEDGYKQKWVLGIQVAVPAGASNVVTNAELKGLESLIPPSSRLQVEAKDAMLRVATGQIEGRYKFPKSGFEKFMEKYEKVEPILDKVLDALKGSLGG